MTLVTSKSETKHHTELQVPSLPCLRTFNPIVLPSLTTRLLATNFSLNAVLLYTYETFCWRRVQDSVIIIVMAEQLQQENVSKLCLMLVYRSAQSLETDWILGMFSFNSSVEHNPNQNIFHKHDPNKFSCALRCQSLLLQTMFNLLLNRGHKPRTG